MSINPEGLTYNNAIVPGIFPSRPPDVLVPVGSRPGTGSLCSARLATTYVYVPNPPTSWFWNIRVGDKIQINNSR